MNYTKIYEQAANDISQSGGSPAKAHYEGVEAVAKAAEQKRPAGSATLAGFSVQTIKEMIEDKYGTIVWGRIDGKLCGYPTSTGQVIITDK